MCGISGIIGELANEINIRKMTSLLKHRGIDHTGYFVDKYIVLGHNRLSIIDLSEYANQPFIYENKPNVLVYNGEIYNYEEIRIELINLGYYFKTNSDTEVLYIAYLEWGEKCLNKLKGMFSFVIWNKTNQTLFAARDRFGVKPFYFYFDGNSFIFSSEIKAIKQVINTKLNIEVVASYLMYGSYGYPNQTFYNDIHQLKGGYFLKFKKQKIEIKQWYDFIGRVKPKLKKNLLLTESHVKEKYKALLERSLSLRFRSDVPLGFTLSGGVDSSLLLALINQRKDASQLKAFTFYTKNSNYDELPWVKLSIKGTKTKLYPVLFEANDFEEWHTRITAMQDEPYGGIPTLAYAKLISKMSEKGIKVILDGQGMDEAWAGYDYYQSISNHIIQGQNNNSTFKLNVLSEDFRQHGKKPIYPEAFEKPLLNKQYRDLFYTKIPRALRFNDRVSMASTTELREPFLDYEMVEFAFSLPEHYKIRNGTGKYLLRQLLSGYTKNIAFSPKRALQTPQREWLGSELSSYVDIAIEKIRYSDLESSFNFDKLNQEWKEYKNGNQNSSFHIWQWISISALI